MGASPAGSWTVVVSSASSTGASVAATSGCLGVALENSRVTDDVLARAREEEDSSLQID